MELAILGGMGESSNRHACAACKHQRRKCQSTCILAPYFPAPDKNEEFQAVHKVFGVSNITKMLSDLDERERDEAVKSFTWEASAWKQDRVHGPLGLYRRLEQERDEMKLKLDIRQKQEQQIQQQHQTLPCDSELGLLGVVTPLRGNDSEERQSCTITNNEETLPNYYYNNLHQGIAAPPPPALPQYAVVQGQKRVNQGSDVPNAQAVTLAVAGTGAVNQDGDSENIASIHPYISNKLRAAHYQGNNSHPGRAKSTDHIRSFWQEQGRPNHQRGGHINIAHPCADHQGSSSYLWPSYRDHIVQGPRIGQDANYLAFQRQQQQQQQPNQFPYIQGQNNQAWMEYQTRSI